MRRGGTLIERGLSRVCVTFSEGKVFPRVCHTKVAPTLLIALSFQASHDSSSPNLFLEFPDFVELFFSYIPKRHIIAPIIRICSLINSSHDIIRLNQHYIYQSFAALTQSVPLLSSPPLLPQCLYSKHIPSKKKQKKSFGRVYFITPYTKSLFRQESKMLRVVFRFQVLNSLSYLSIGRMRRVFRR